MTPQEVIKNFMEMLDNHSYKLSRFDVAPSATEKNELSTKILDRAVQASSTYGSMQELINAFIADCRTYNTNDSVNGWKNFLSEKCGIDMDNTDTGAITGSDANVTVEGAIVGDGVSMNAGSVVPEYGNYYKAETTAPQLIDTGNNGWMVVATSGNDSIISGGEDSICAGAGSNFITVKGSRATIDAADGNNTIVIEDGVKSVVLLNCDSSRVTLSGNTSVVTYGKNSSPATNANAVSTSSSAIWVEDGSVENSSGMVPGTPQPSGTKRILLASNGNVASNDSDIIIKDYDNYFNTDGTTTYSGEDFVTVNLSGAIDSSNPVPAGGFIVSNNSTDASFVSTNAAAQNGQLVGQVASVYPGLMSFTFKGLTLNVADRRLNTADGKTVTLKTFSSFNDVGNDTDNAYEKYVVASIYKWWMKEGLALAYRNYDYSFEDPDATTFVINLHFDKTEGGSNALASTSYSFYYSGKTISLDLSINKDYYKDLTDYNDVDGTSKTSGAILLDRTLAHEFTHAVMAAKDDYLAFLPKFVVEGMAEVTHGIDDIRGRSIQQLAKNADSLSSVVRIDGEEYTISDYSYAGGYMLLRYFAKQTALNTQGIYVPSQMTVNVNLNGGNATYYVGNTEQSPTAATTTAKYSVGAAENHVYTMSDMFKQNIKIIDTGAWSLQVDSPENTIIAGAGNDGIILNGSENVISGGAGSDTIIVNGSANNIDAGSGSDRITVYGSANSINGGADNDIIQNNFGDGGNYFVYDFTSGNDTITQFKAKDKLVIAGDYSTAKSGSNIIVSLKKNGYVVGSITLNQVASNFSEANNIITVKSAGEAEDSKLITLTDNADNYTNDSDGVTIQALGGDDTITNTNSNASVDGGAGDDSINLNGGEGVTVNTTQGDDTIEVGAGVTAFHVEGFSSGDTIKLSENISGLSIVDGRLVANYGTGKSVTISGINSVCTVTGGWSAIDNGVSYLQMTIAGAASSGNNIVYSSDEENKTLFTITGIANTDGITIENKTVTLKNANLKNANVTISNGYTLALANDVPIATTTPATWSISGTTATYKNSSTTAGYTLADNKITYTDNSGGETLATVTGVKSTDGLSFNGNIITVSNAALNQDTVTVSNGCALALADDVTKSTTTPAGWSLDGNTATYKNSSTTAGYTLANNRITYTAASGGETLATVTGVKSTNGLSLRGTTITVSNAALNQDTVTVSNGYTLALGRDVTKPKTTSAAWSISGTTATYKNSSTTAGYTLADNKISYTAASGGETLATVTGVKSTNGLSLSGNTITVSSAALNQSTVTVSNGYTLALGRNVTAPKTTAAGWSLSGNTATYKNSSTTEGYTLANNEITYTTAGGGERIDVAGVKSLSGLSFSGDTITVSAASLDKKDVTVSNNNYKLVLAGGLAPKDDGLSLTAKSKTSATLDSWLTEGYTLNSNRIIYSPAKINSTVATVTGLKSGFKLNQLSFDERSKIITVDADALGNSSVKISGGYKLELADGDIDAQISRETWTIKNGTATLKGNISASYSLSADGRTIKYTAPKNNVQLAKITGLNKNFSGKLTEANGVITLPEAVLSTSKVKLTGDYKLALNDSLTTATKKASWTVSGTTATYSLVTTAHYNIDATGKNISYTATVPGSGKDVLATVSGLKKGLVAKADGTIDGIKLKGNTITVSDTVLSRKKVTLKGNYELDITDDVAPTATRSLTATKTTATFTEQLEAGYTLSADGKSIDYLKRSSKTTLATVNGTSRALTASKFNASTETVSLSKSDLSSTVTIGGTYAFNFAAGDYGNTIVMGSSKADTLNLKGNKISVNAGGGDDVVSVGGMQVTVNGDAGNDIITVSGSSNNIYGGQGNDKITLTGADNTVSGGKGNDSLWGGKNSDTFIYGSGDGNDIIYNFDDGDMLKITGAFSATCKRNEINFKVGNTNNAITLKNFTAENFNINGSTYVVSSGKLVKK